MLWCIWICAYKNANQNISYVCILRIKLKISISWFCYVFGNHPTCLLNDIVPQQSGAARYSTRLVGGLLSVCNITASYRATYSIEYNYWWRVWRNPRIYTPGMSGTVTKRGNEYRFMMLEESEKATGGQEGFWEQNLCNNNCFHKFTPVSQNLLFMSLHWVVFLSIYRLTYYLLQYIYI